MLIIQYKGETTMDYKVKEWGTLPDGTICHLIELSHGSISLYVSDYGATFQSMFVTDSSGTQHDIILGYDTPEEYYYDQQNFGGTMGRFANRIAGACITLNGKDWHLPANEGNNTLHSGHGFNKCMWQFKVNSDSLILTLNSPHLDNGFPGNLTVTQTITITDNHSIHVHYDAVSDMDTVCNFTNHSYFNFSGIKNICGLTVSIGADYYTPVDSHSIPTGDILPVAGTMYDFRNPRTVGTEYIDINYVLSDTYSYASKVTDSDTGITMSVKTDFPGLQLYNGNYIGNCTGKYGIQYNDQHGICFEPQFFPDAMHHNNFPSPVIKAGEHLDRYIEYIFE